MTSELTKMYRKRRDLNTRVTNKNKDAIINKINKLAKSYGFQKMNKNSSLNDVRSAKNYYSERMGYDILTLSIQQGNITTTELIAKDLKNSMDSDTRNLAKFGKKLAMAKQRQNSYISNDEEEFLSRGNLNIKGFGELDVITMFENAKNKKERDTLINEIYTSNPKEEFYNGEIDVFKRVFRKVGLTREDDIKKVIENLNNSSMEELTDKTNNLIQTLELYGSPNNSVGKWDGDETELANARLDDMMIRMGLLKTGKRKVNKVYKKAKKYNDKYKVKK